MSSPAAAARSPTRSPRSPVTKQHAELSTSIEVDNDPHSDYESGLQSDTTSVSSSVFDFTYDNGRRYTKWGGDSKYMQPNDETEQDRLDMNHHYQNIVLGGELFTAPLEHPQRVLDCGTGTGIWALDFGDRYPAAEVTGVDLSPIQPSWVAPNVKFELDDIEKDWTFPQNHFDFIHSRHLSMGIHNWRRYVEQIFAHLAPGGWAEFSEQEQAIHSDDGTLEGSALKKWFDTYIEIAPKAGLHFVDADALVALLEAAGFTEVSVRTFKQPWGAWPKDKKMKELGRIATAIAETGLHSHGLALFTQVGGLSPEEAKKICDDTQADINGRKVHAYNRLWHIIARKPEA